MTQDEVHKFYSEMAAVCHKYQIQAMVGMWFSGTSDLYGFVKQYDLADTDMKAVADHIANRLEEWADGIYKGPQEGYHTSIQGVDNQKN